MFSRGFFRISSPLRPHVLPSLPSSQFQPHVLQFANFSTRKPKYSLTKEIVDEMKKRAKDPSVSEETRSLLKENIRFARRVVGRRKSPKEYRNVFKERYQFVRTVFMREYNEEMLGYLRTRRFDKAERYFQDLKDADDEPNLVTFNIMLQCAFHREDYESRAEELLQEMKSYNISPDLQTKNILLKIQAKKGKEHLLKYWDTMKEEGFPHNSDSYAILLQQLGAFGDFDLLQKFYSQMHENEIDPNVNVANSVIEVYARRGELEEMRKWVKEFESKRVFFNGRTFHLLARGYQQHGIEDVIAEWIEDGTFTKTLGKSVVWTTQSLDAILSLWKSYQLSREAKRTWNSLYSLVTKAYIPRELEDDEADELRHFLHMMAETLSNEKKQV